MAITYFPRLTSVIALHVRCAQWCNASNMIGPLFDTSDDKDIVTTLKRVCR